MPRPPSLPPSQPPLPSPPLPPFRPSLPSPPPLMPFPPATPGFKLASSTTDIIQELATQRIHGQPLQLELPLPWYPLEGNELELQGRNLTLVGAGPDGATIDAQNLSRIFRIARSGHL
eukprot:6202361-Pleurochrysis_carterae.AAC.1